MLDRPSIEDMEKELAELLDDYLSAPLDRVTDLQLRLRKPEALGRLIEDLIEGSHDSTVEVRTKKLEHAHRLQSALARAQEQYATLSPSGQVKIDTMFDESRLEFPNGTQMIFKGRARRFTLNLSARVDSAAQLVQEVSGCTQADAMSRGTVLLADALRAQYLGGGIFIQEHAGADPVKVWIY